MPRIRLLEVSGTPFEMGYQHGTAYCQDIRALAAERLRLCTDETWTGRQLSRQHVLDLAQACVEEHARYSPELMEELEGIAAASQVSAAELIIANGFTDFIDVLYSTGETRQEPVYVNNDCTTVMANEGMVARGAGVLGQTWDMHNSATPYVILMRGRPVNQPRFLVFTLTGCVGMIGLNDAGIAVGINNLLSANGQPGVTWTFVVRQILAQTNLKDALRCITSANLAGGHNYYIMDRDGNGYSVEAMPEGVHVEELHGIQTHANACLSAKTRRYERDLSDDLVEDSIKRRSRAEELLSVGGVTPENLMALTRDTANDEYSICSFAAAPYFSETCGAAVMQPDTGEFWGVWGLPTENEYERFVV